MNPLIDIQRHLDGRANSRLQRERIDESPHTRGDQLTMIDWDELNVAIDALCAEFKTAQAGLKLRSAG